MRYLVVSDIHGNFAALSAVLHHCRRKRFDHVLFLGDAVGYGASPNQVMAWLASLGTGVTSVRGNHDRVCAGLDTAEYFNRYAKEAAAWTHDHLEPRHLQRLRGMPVGPRRIEPGLVICHGSPVDEDAYIFSAHDALAAFDVASDEVILFGHTHVPSAFIGAAVDGRHMIQARLLSGRRTVLDLDPDNRYMINPGSVGQPRDRDPRAAYAIYDHGLRRLYQYRVLYRIQTARRKILQAGLPPVLGDRLVYGA